MSNAGTINEACPSLGLLDDAETALAFPSVWNCCYRSNPASPPKIKYQEEFCLRDHHRECPLFLREQSAPLPAHMRAPRSRVKRVKNAFRRELLVVLVIIAVLFALAAALWGRQLFLPFGPRKATVAASALAAPTASDTPAPLPTGTPTASFISADFKGLTPAAQTVTPAERLPKHQLEVPIGNEHKFVIHRVLNGENLDQYAPRYDTSVEAILAVNYALKLPVWVGILVVIPSGFTDVSDLPVFEAWQITETGITVESLARQFNADLFDLNYYNSIDVDERLQIGDWLLIPHTRTEP